MEGVGVGSVRLGRLGEALVGAREARLPSVDTENHPGRSF